MTENKRFIITLETIVEAEDLFEAVKVGYELKNKYGLDLKGVMVCGDVE